MPKLSPIEEFCENLGANFVGSLESMLISSVTSYLQNNGVSNANLHALGLGGTPNNEHGVESPLPTIEEKVEVPPKKKTKKAKETKEPHIIDMVEENGVWV